MARKKLREFGTNLEGMGFSDAVIGKVWEKGEIVPGKDPDLYRYDAAGNMIFWHSYGKDSKMGWQIDHKKPLAKGGTDELRNLQPLQTRENKKKSDQYPW